MESPPNRQTMTGIEFTSIVDPSQREELERLLFFNQNQDKVQEELPLLIRRYGMARVIVSNDRLRVVLDSSPEPQTLFALEEAGVASPQTDGSIPQNPAHLAERAGTKKSDGPDRLVGVMVYLREHDTLSLIIAAVREDYAGARSDRKEPLARSMVDVLREIARRVKGIRSVTVFPGTSREKKLPPA